MSLLHLINPTSLKKFKAGIKNKEPFPHFSFDGFLDEDFANEIHNSFPSYEDSKLLGREFSSVNEKSKIQITDSAKFHPAIYKLHQLLTSQEFVDILSEYTGIPNLLADPDLMGGGIHETNSGGHLDVHVDFNYIEEKQWHRRVNILFYFNKDWKEEYGGYLDIWDKDVKKCYGSFAPLFNQASGFVTSEISYHGVTPITCPPDKMRKSFAVYYYTKEAPAGWNGEIHSTVFKPRPDEWLKGNVLMPSEKIVRNVNKLVKKLKNNVKK